jgi:hypothetical protein
MRWQFLLATFFVSVCVSHGPTADAQQTRALSDKFRLHDNFQSKFLKKDRDVIVWLPPGYDSAERVNDFETTGRSNLV